MIRFLLNWKNNIMGIFFLLLRNQEKENVHVMEKVLRSLKEKKLYDKIPPELKEQYIETLHKIIKQDLELDNSIEELREYRKELEVTYNALVDKSRKLEYSNQVLETRVTNLSNINSLSRTVLSIVELDHIINIILDAYFVLTGAKKSNQVLETRVTNLSNINSLSRTVLSIVELDHIINIILDAYFVLTGAKKVSLYLWEEVTNLSNINSLSRTVLSIVELDHIINIILDAYFVLTGAKKVSLYLWEEGKLINKQTRGNVNFRGEVSYPIEILQKFTYQDYKRVYEELKKGFQISPDEVIVVSPLLVKGKELGVIFIIEDKNKFIGNDEETISALTIQVAIAINNAKIYADLRVKERILGVIFIIEDKNKFIGNDEETISALTIQVAIAINNAKIYADLRVKERISQELEVASRIQKTILPKNITNIYGLQIANYFEPAKEVGGDYYDYTVKDDENVSITIADVSGKGVPAAFLMALGRSILKTLERQGQSPADNLRNLNQIIYPDITED